MLTTDEKRLQIFDSFIRDENLPKFKAEDMNVRMGLSAVGGPRFGESPIPFQSMNIDSADFYFDYGQVKRIRASWKRRFQFLFKGYDKKEKKKESESPKPEISIDDFFKSIKNNSKELAKIEKRVESYVEAAKHAEAMGQTALKEKIEAQLDVVRSETQLYACGFKTIITEEQVVKFYKKSEKGIRLNFIKNFTRIIPDKFLEIKKSLDEKCIFDNYCVLHYDPELEGYALTHKEVEEAKKKDPILFGLIQGSRKLYYIGDWVDEYCDLTLEKFIDEFGKFAINKNNISATIKNDQNV